MTPEASLFTFSLTSTVHTFISLFTIQYLCRFIQVTWGQDSGLEIQGHRLDWERGREENLL